MPNGHGRIWRIQDQSGILSREYGKLGETVKESRRVFTKNSSESYDTGFVYDSWGRLRELKYPDGEVLTYAYDSGGQMSSAVGVKGSRQTAYVAALGYDKFGQRAYINKNNVTETFYTYDGLNRRLTQLVTKSAGSTPVIQNMTYAYDQVDNITGLMNDVTGSLVGRQMGGATEQRFEYDDLNRMTGASGVYRGDEHYTLSMSYDAIHNITSKHQKHWGVKKNGGQSIKKKTSYNFVYRYDGVQPHAPTVIGGTDYTYDLNGNQTGFKSHNTTRVITWDEENRIQSIADGGSKSSYRYDYSGARVLKEHKQGSTAYVSQFYAIRNGTIQTKHVMAGSDRIQSEVITSTDSVSYYYHPDHLGSTNYVTDDKGDIYEHMEYFPFGELWVSERGNTEKTPYLYTSKELDEDTQLMYFGARYYDARTSVWQSPDPALGQYLSRKEGNSVYAPGVLGLYGYGALNPVKYSDPDGREVWVPMNSLRYFTEDVNSRGGSLNMKGNLRKQGISYVSFGGVNYAVFRKSSVIGRAKSMKHLRQAAGDSKIHVVAYVDAGTDVKRRVHSKGGQSSSPSPKRIGIKRFESPGSTLSADGYRNKRLGMQSIQLVGKNGKAHGIRANSVTLIVKDLISRTILGPMGDAPGSRRDRSEILGHEMGHAVDYVGKFSKEYHMQLFDSQGRAARGEDGQTYDSSNPDDRTK